MSKFPHCERPGVVRLINCRRQLGYERKFHACILPLPQNTCTNLWSLDVRRRKLSLKFSSLLNVAITITILKTSLYCDLNLKIPFSKKQTWPFEKPILTKYEFLACKKSANLQFSLYEIGKNGPTILGAL